MTHAQVVEKYSLCVTVHRINEILYTEYPLQEGNRPLDLRLNVTKLNLYE